MSGHITRMSRGSRVGSSASRPEHAPRAAPRPGATARGRRAPARCRSSGSSVRRRRVDGRRWRRCRAAASRAGVARRASSSEHGRRRSPRPDHRVEGPLELAQVATERGEQRVADPLVRVVLAAGHRARRGRPARPTARPRGAAARGGRRGAPRARRAARPRSPGCRVWPNRENRAGRSTSLGPLAQCREHVAVALTGRGRADPRDEQAPQLGLPGEVGVERAAGAVGVAAGLPVGEQGRPLHGVRREQPGQPPGDRSSGDRAGARPPRPALARGRGAG